MGPRTPYPAVQVLWGLPTPTPRGRGISPSGASDFFDAEKVTKKAPGTPRSQIFCLIGLYQWRKSSATESGFCHLICDLVVNDTPPAGLLKGDMFLGVLAETCFLGRNLGSIRRNSGQVSFYAGESKGGAAPFVSSWGWGT